MLKAGNRVDTKSVQARIIAKQAEVYVCPWREFLFIGDVQ